MRFAIHMTGVVIGVPLELMIIARMLRGGYRKFPLVFVYSILNFLATVVEFPSMVAFYYRGVVDAGRTSADYWWNNEAIFQVLNYLVVMSLIYQATAQLRSRRILRVSLFAGAILFAGVTFLVHYNPTILTGLWMTPWTRDLNFCSAILDMTLWALLIGRKEKDQRVLLLSSGMGVQFTGEAIGGSLRQLAQKDRSRALSLTGGVIMMLANLVLLFVWWHAFRRPARQRHLNAGVAPLPRPEEGPPALP
jgi:cbb3-type cytochrome oxidase subunit 3